MANTDPQSYQDIKAAVIASVRLGLSVWLHYYRNVFYLTFDHANDTTITDDIARKLITHQLITHQLPTTYAVKIGTLAWERYRELTEWNLKTTTM